MGDEVSGPRACGEAVKLEHFTEDQAREVRELIAIMCAESVVGWRATVREELAESIRDVADVGRVIGRLTDVAETIAAVLSDVTGITKCAMKNS